jgi:hypothetical protein
MEVMILLAIMCCVLLLLIMITQLHKKELKECFNEQARFSKKLLDLEEQEEEKVEIDEQEEPIYKTTTSCQCETPGRTVFKVDEIKLDKTNKVQFVDDVQMNRAEVSGTLTINETPFATFDAASNKLIIG